MFGLLKIKRELVDNDEDIIISHLQWRSVTYEDNKRWTLTTCPSCHKNTLKDVRWFAKNDVLEDDIIPYKYGYIWEENEHEYTICDPTYLQRNISFDTSIIETKIYHMMCNGLSFSKAVEFLIL